MKPEIRKKIESTILKYVNKVDASGLNGKLYKKFFATAKDIDIDVLIDSAIPIYAPNGGEVDIDHMKNVEIMRELGYDPEQYCWLTDPKTNVTSRTAHKHLVLRLPVRRQSQMIDKKVSTATHNRTIDAITGQTVGQSKGSSFSFPQMYVMYAKGYDNTLRELINIRGGNAKAGKAVDRQIRLTGASSAKFEGSENTRVGATVTLGVIFKAMHLANNL